jgi:transposase InsO family protein
MSELEKIPAFTLHRQKPKVRRHNPFYMYYKRQQLQADLIDVQKLASSNDHVKYILVIIDCFTKKAAVTGLTDKKMTTTLLGVKKILFGPLAPLPQSIVFDQGKEFNNRLMDQFLREHGIASFNPSGEHKAAIAERFNRTLQSLIYKYLTHYRTERYIHVLDKLLATYNNRYHRTIKMTPNNAEKPNNQHLVRQAHEARYSSLLDHKGTPEYSVGDIVRLKVWKSTFARGYKNQFTDELFKVISIKDNMPIPMYIVQSLNDSVPIQGAFYGRELQRFRPP